MRAQAETLAVERMADARLGLTRAATGLAVGILAALYRCRKGGDGSLLEYSPDFAAERASDVLDRCRRHGITLPEAELLDLTPGWASMLSGG